MSTPRVKRSPQSPRKLTGNQQGQQGTPPPAAPPAPQPPPRSLLIGMQRELMMARAVIDVIRIALEHPGMRMTGAVAVVLQNHVVDVLSNQITEIGKFLQGGAP